MLEFKEQTASELKLFVDEDIFKLEDYTVVQKSSFATNKFDVVFGILAESHFVSIGYKSKRFDELCICTDIQINGTEEIILLNHLEQKISNGTEDFIYESEVVCLKNNEAVDRIAKMKSKNDELNTYHLLHVFPTIKKDDEKAITAVYITDLDDSLSIETVHTYPEEDKYVFLTSIVKPRP